jgi:hypothetical protein
MEKLPFTSCAGCFALIDFIFPSWSLLLVSKPPGGVLKFAFSFCDGFARSSFLAASQHAGGFVCLSHHWFSRSRSGLNPISVSTTKSIFVRFLIFVRTRCCSWLGCSTTKSIFVRFLIFVLPPVLGASAPEVFPVRKLTSFVLLD